MKFIAKWGKADNYRAGRDAESTVFGEIEFEANSWQHAKATATRKMKADPKMKRYVKTEETLESGEVVEFEPPRWTPWVANELDVFTMKRTQQSFDLPIFYVDPDKNREPQHPGHYGWLHLYCEAN